jgi:hypothetical protein
MEALLATLIFLNLYEIGSSINRIRKGENIVLKARHNVVMVLISIGWVVAGIKAFGWI